MDERSKVKECVASLQKLLSDSNFAAQCSTYEDLCQILCDGEVLCTVLTVLTPDRITSNEYTYLDMNSHYLARNNLDYFRAQCLTEFSMPEEEVFQPDDLLTMSNPEKVISTIYKLVCTPGVLTPKPRPWSSISSGSIVMDNMIMAICDSENSLVEKLNKLLLYRSELLGVLSEWNKDLVGVVFRFTEQLHSIHSELHTRLNALADQGPEQFCRRLSVMFREMAQKLEVLDEYYSNLPSTNARIEEEFKKNPLLKVQLDKLDSHFSSGHSSLKFRALLDAPVRHHAGYIMLFKRLQTAAEKEIPHAASSVGDAVAVCAGLLDRFIEYRSQAEKLLVTTRILSRINQLPTELSDPAQIGLHRADECLKVRIVKDRKPENMLCFCLLTQKQLIFSIKQQKKEELQSTFAFEIPIARILEVKKCENALRLEINQDNNEKVICESSTRSADQLERLRKILDETRVENKPTGWDFRGHQFELKTFPQGTHCSNCKEVLLGLCMQGYGCSHCDSSLHRSCLWPTVRPLQARDVDHANLSREGAEAILANKPMGAFLLRNSSMGGKALSVKVNQEVKHINIHKEGGKHSLGPGTTLLDSLDDLLAFYRENKLSTHFTHLDFALTHGVEVGKVN